MQRAIIQILSDMRFYLICHRKRVHDGSGDGEDSPEVTRREIRLTSILHLRKEVKENMHPGMCTVRTGFYDHFLEQPPVIYGQVPM